MRSAATRRATRFRLTGFSFVERILMHPWRSDHTMTVLMDPPQAPHQARILLSTRAWLAMLPGL